MTHDVEDMRRMLITLARELVAIPEAVTVETVEKADSVLLKLRVAPSDVGAVIGKRGHTARSLRTILATFGLKANRCYILEIVDEGAGTRNRDVKTR